MTLRSIVGLCCAGMALAACKTTPPVPYESSSADVSAVIVNPTTESRAELQRAVSHLLSGADVLLADDALTHSSTLSIERRRTGSVENPPLSGRDLGEPERFRLLLTGKGCLLVHESTQVAMPLTETDCVPEA